MQGRDVSVWRLRGLTAGVDEDFDRTVISVLVSQGDHDAGGRAGQRVGVGSDSMRRAFYTYKGQQAVIKPAD